MPSAQRKLWRPYLAREHEALTTAKAVGMFIDTLEDISARSLFSVLLRFTFGSDEDVHMFISLFPSHL